MKVYRCLNKVEKELFDLGFICSRKGSEQERKIRINTHDYGNVETICKEDKIKSERVHYFLFVEDALNYFLTYRTEICCIAEYELPDDLVINNIGCGFYCDMIVQFVLETAIPYAELIKDSDKDAYNILTKGILSCDSETVTRHSSRVMKIREKLEDLDLHIPSHIANFNYNKKILQIPSDINLETKYNEFTNGLCILEILEALNIKLVMDNYLFDSFVIDDKKVDIERLKAILEKYELLEKEKCLHL